MPALLALAAAATFSAALAQQAKPAPSPAASGALPSIAQLDALAQQSRQRWQGSAHGPMLERLLPESLQPSQLPEPQSRGARLTALYCVQCHHLPNPAMHESARWPRVVERMVPRMQGQGNMGRLMAEMMRGPAAAQQVAAAAPADAPPLAAPSRSETREIVDYLRRHAQRPLSVHDNPRLARDLDTPAGKMFEQACAQCHALPDPRSHTAAEWPAVVHRMERNMLWMNRIVGSRADPREPQLRPSEIIGFLQRHARR